MDASCDFFCIKASALSFLLFSPWPEWFRDTHMSSCVLFTIFRLRVGAAVVVGLTAGQLSAN
jgi:hypothetical protein